MMAPILNEFTKENFLARAMYQHINSQRRVREKKTKAMHIASKFVTGYRDLSELLAVDEKNGQSLKMSDFVERHHRPPTLALIDGHNVPVQGIMAILAVSRLLGDTDCLGGGFKNSGFVVQKGPDDAPVSVLCVKIDTGFSFNFTGAENVYTQSFISFTKRKLGDMCDIQFGNNQTYEIEFKCLLPEQKRMFLEVFHIGMKRLQSDHCRIMNDLLWQDGHFNRGKSRVKHVEVKQNVDEWLRYLKVLSKTYESSGSDSDITQEEEVSLSHSLSFSSPIITSYLGMIFTIKTSFNHNVTSRYKMKKNKR